MPKRPQPPRDLDETALATLVSKGDAAAYTAVFDAYYLPIVRFLIRYLGSEDAAKDAAQDVFIRLWDGRAAIDPTRSLKAYLFVGARNRALDLLARHDLARRYEEDFVNALGEDAEVLADPGADMNLVAAELLQIAEARIATLSPRLRQVYHLNRHEGMTAAEIAEVFGTSVHTVYTQLTKIVQELLPILRTWMEE